MMIMYKYKYSCAMAFALLCSLSTSGFCAVLKKAPQNCGYESCNAEKPGMVNVHLVPHTHDDVGWLVTVDQYYYKEVQWILDGVVQELAADPNKRFIYVEIAFFARWFNEQNAETQKLVKNLVNEGRLEFILGGWCMNDEAAPHYTAIIDQHKLGFEFLRDNFGECARPKIGWQIDPFGHSREQASLFAQFGFDGLFFGRLDYQDKDMRQKEKRMEFLWRGSPNNLGSQANLFTGVLPNMYQPPDGFWFDVGRIFTDPEQTMIMDDPRLHDYNVEKMVDNFIKAVNDQAKNFATDHLIMTMGSDFNYIQAHMYFSELDKLIEYVNARQAVGSNVNVLYSTPSCYLKQLNNDNRTWTTKEDDFFPYADREDAFWTGYFTSRPALKRYDRVVNNFFQSVKQMSALAMLEDSRDPLLKLAEVLGVNMHHDAISGTEKQAVTYDYAQRLAEGVNGALGVVNKAYKQLMYKTGSEPPDQIFCLTLNISLCNFTQMSSNFQVTMYNPLARPVTTTVRLPVSGLSYKVLSEDGITQVPSDMVPLSAGSYRIPTPWPRSSSKELVFVAKVKPVGFVTYFVQETSESNSLKFESEVKQPLPPKQEVKKPIVGATVIEGKYYGISFDDNGNLASITNKTSGTTLKLNQNFFYYKGAEGNCSEGKFQSSGAYIFRPQDNTPTKIGMTVTSKEYKGSVVQEIEQIGSWVSQVFRVYNDKPYVEVEWTVGPIPIDDKVGKEVITRYNVENFGNDGVFYTDANGREVLQRKLNYRPSWKLNQTEPVSGNYYPVNAFLSIKSGDGKMQFTVLTDRSEGGTSLNDGDLELMLHRRLLFDDHKGVGEPLNETGIDGKGLVVRGTHYLMFDTVDQAPLTYRTVAQEVFLTPQITFSNLNTNPQQYWKEFYSNRSMINHPLPYNIHLLTLERFQNSGPVPSADGTVPYLIRLENFYENDEVPYTATFDIQTLFTTFSITDVHELSLGANILASDVHRLTWRSEDNSGDPQPVISTTPVKGTVVTLSPMQIVTLQANVKMTGRK